VPYTVHCTVQRWPVDFGDDFRNEVGIEDNVGYFNVGGLKIRALTVQRTFVQTMFYTLIPKG